MPTHRSETALLLQPWSTALSQTKKKRMASTASPFSSMIYSHGSVNSQCCRRPQKPAVTAITSHPRAKAPSNKSVAELAWKILLLCGRRVIPAAVQYRQAGILRESWVGKRAQALVKVASFVRSDGPSEAATGTKPYLRLQVSLFTLIHAHSIPGNRDCKNVSQQRETSSRTSEFIRAQSERKFIKITGLFH